ncbi:MAG: metallophosphoesterase family protein [Anaerolineaceae bacterium]|nr:metallophosphoesterase family protein [Anaerolineaceae bacterium]
MRVLIISDIHANLSALDAVRFDSGPVDAVWCLGDLVGYGPDPNQCIERIAELPGLVCQLGNHDAAVLGLVPVEEFNLNARLSIRWSSSVLTAACSAFLQTLTQMTTVGEVTLCHGSPRNPVWEYILDPRTAAASLDYFETPYCFVGHSHLPVCCTSLDKSKPVHLSMIRNSQAVQLIPRTIINPGSVGQPRDKDPRAAYAIYYTEEHRWEPRRVNYDIHAVQERIYKAGLPPLHASRLAQGT